MQLETERLLLRELTDEDFTKLYEILSDKETMEHYPKPFTEEKVKDWITWNKENYKTFGFGLFAVVLKENGHMIGDCGITMQAINGRVRPEIGYHINKNYQKKGYATEAARRCRDFIFENTPFNMVYTYMKYSNISSYTVAIKNGMRFVEEYEDPVNSKTKVYAITRKEWQHERSEKR
ncbi:MAG: GNAT family N-acetyltransferase [bacterium]|nr:GNAT family N-acetyltransferase [bacterium]